MSSLAQLEAEVRPSRADPRYVLLVYTEAGSPSDQSQDGADSPHPHQDRGGVSQSLAESQNITFYPDSLW